VEEDVLLPVAAGWIDPGAEPVVRMLVEHVRIRAAALRLERDPDPALAPLHELGTLLQQHVRLEEREVFPLIEAAMPEAEAERLAALVMQAEGEGSPPAGR
jgi:hemerythrin-like domain-containing protein